MATMTMYRVTELGREQIREWMIQNYRPEMWNNLVSFGREAVEDAIDYWAERAEDSQNGEIELSIRDCRHPWAVCLTPDRQTFYVVD